MTFWESFLSKIVNAAVRLGCYYALIWAWGADTHSDVATVGGAVVYLLAFGERTDG